MKAHLPALGLILLAFSAATAEDVTVAQVLARPREFVGKRVSVTGFFVAANEESSLYITRESAKRGDIDRSIWVELHGASNFRAAVNRYVRFIGTFHYRSKAAAKDMRGYGQWGLSPSQLDVMSFELLR
jgi:hypothetical protein